MLKTSFFFVLMELTEHNQGNLGEDILVIEQEIHKINRNPIHISVYILVKFLNY